MSNNRSKILIIGMADSVHLARWLSQFIDQPIDFTIFPSSPHRRIHPLLKGECGSSTEMREEVRKTNQIFKIYFFVFNIFT